MRSLTLQTKYSPPIHARFICTVCIRVGSGDPVRVLRLLYNNTLDTIEEFIAETMKKLVPTESNVLLYLLPMSVQLC